MSEPMTPKTLQPRHYLLAGGLAVAVAATLWAAQIEDEPAAVQAAAGQRRAAAPVAGTRATVPAAPAPAPSDWRAVQREAFAEVPVQQFAAWQPPPPPPPPPAPPPPPPAPPMAPAFPYQLIGRLQDGPGAAAQQAFLTGPQRSVTVRVGEVLDGQWRVEQIGPTGLTVTYLPLQLKQSVAFRPAS